VAQEALRKLALGALLALAVSTSLPAAAQSLPSGRGQGPEWASLTADQQQTLAPLATEWGKLNADQRRKWIGIAKRYPTLNAQEQQRIQKRMQAWTRLTHEQRWQARQQYRSLGTLAPDKRDELHRYWAEYQSLSPHEKRMFDVQPVETRAAERKRRAAPKKTAPAGPSPALQFP
jgi:hypothetical protein